MVRVHHSWLAARERRLLIRLAARMPGWIKPDYLTVVGCAGALVAGLAYAATGLSPRYLWLASLGLIVNWFGDSLDGTLARHRGIERPRYGFFVDHTTDVASQAFIFLGLGASQCMRFDIACLALMSYWIAALYTFIRALATGIFQISYGGIGPTEIRLGLIAYNLAFLAVGPVTFATPFGPATPLDAICAVIFVVVFGAFLTLIVLQGRRLARVDAAGDAPVDRPAPGIIC